MIGYLRYLSIDLQLMVTIYNIHYRCKKKEDLSKNHTYSTFPYKCCIKFNTNVFFKGYFVLIVSS